MNLKDLKETGKIYDHFIQDWIYYGTAFRAGKNFINLAINQHPSESKDNYNLRISEGFNFPYCQNIVTIYNYFLTEKPAIREIDKSIKENPKWISYKKNCDLYGASFDSFLNEAQKLAGAYGTVGILVDYPPGTKAVDDPAARPYLSLFTPNNILDWTYKRNTYTGVPELIYLKLKESTNVYLVWTPETWTRYTVDEKNNNDITEESGDNRLGKVPFVFLPNVKDITYPYLGVSDLTDACYVNAAIIRCLSMGNEVIKLAGFPMLLLPKESENSFLEDTTDTEEEVIVSEDTVLQFDPDAKNGRPSWLESPIEPSIKAILMWIDRLTEEMYRSANLAGLHQNRDKAQTKSSTYLRYQFQQTNAVLSKKAESLIETERKLNEFWCLWEDVEYNEEQFKIARVKEFSIDALQIEIDNMITAMDNVLSDTFKTKTQKRLAKQAIPDLSETELTNIENEIRGNLEKDNSVEEDNNSIEGDDE